MLRPPSTSHRSRQQFPLLQRQINGQPLVYLDSANTSQKPRTVIDAMTRFMETSYAPINRSAYQLAAEATDAYEGARKAVRRFINAPRADELIFTKNATEGLNLVAYSWGRANLAAGDVVVLTQMEHHANIVPWHMLAAERGIELRWVPLTNDGQLDLTNLAVAARRRQGLQLHGDEQRARHDHPGPSAVRRRSRRRCVGHRRRLPVRPAQRHRRAGLGCRLRRLQQPQDVRPVGHRRALGARGAARCDAAVPRWRQHDRRCSPRRFHPRRAAGQVRGRHTADRRSHRAQCRHRLPRGSRDGQRAPPRDGDRDLRDGHAQRSVRRRHLPARSRPTSRSAAQRSASGSATSTRTTCRRSSINATSACGPATTAPSR